MFNKNKQQNNKTDLTRCIGNDETASRTVLDALNMLSPLVSLIGRNVSAGAMMLHKCYIMLHVTSYAVT